MKAMKFYFWDNILRDYTNGIAFAYAENRKEAKQLIIDKYKKEKGYISDMLLEDLKAKPIIINKKYAFVMWGGG